MINLSLLHYFLGFQIWRMNDGILFSHPKYATYLLAWFHMSNCKHSPTPFQFGVKSTIECDIPLVDATLHR